MGSLIRSIIRVLSFPREEIVEMLRQPRLVLTLILGPFLILLLVGIGYRGERPPLRTEFVVDQQNPLKSSIEKLSSATTAHFVIQGTTSDDAGALTLAARRTDLLWRPGTPPRAFRQVNRRSLPCIIAKLIQPRWGT
jgi:ABC-2 type transport system permease protein